MKVVYTAAARQDLEDIGNWLALHYPALAPAVERRIRIVVARIARWPESARLSARHAGVRTVRLVNIPTGFFTGLPTMPWKSCISTMQRVNRGLKKNEATASMLDWPTQRA